ncbi:MAG: FAD-dependent oxidoreductase [Steroidobacteraceae bacterium]
MRIAVIGTGIGGLGAAHRLHRQHELTLFEAGAYIGGHTATVDVELEGRHWAVDTGFIVFNDWTYPRFVELLRELDVPSQRSDMSFSLRCERTGFEYNGTSLNTLFAQRRNLLRPSYLRMLTEILSFNARASRSFHLSDPHQTLADYLKEHGYSKRLIQQYLVPMGRAIWSASESAMLSFPARFFIDFFRKHGFLNYNDRPQWRSVRGGSRSYVTRLVAPFRHRIHLQTPVAGVRRTPRGVMVRTADGHVETFDALLLACHADQALRLLEDPSPVETDLLGAFPYETNEVLLHTDARMLPRAPLARAAWNYHALDREQQAVAVTYDMNVLQALPAPVRFLVTMNRSDDVDPSTVLRSFRYDHPVYTPRAVQAQRRHDEISGTDRTFYAGAYWGAGFHEDGLLSGYRAAEQIEAWAALHRPIEADGQLVLA